MRIQQAAWLGRPCYVIWLSIEWSWTPTASYTIHLFMGQFGLRTSNCASEATELHSPGLPASSCDAGRISSMYSQCPSFRGLWNRHLCAPSLTSIPFLPPVQHRQAREVQWNGTIIFHLNSQLHARDDNPSGHVTHYEFIRISMTNQESWAIIKGEVHPELQSVSEQGLLCCTSGLLCLLHSVWRSLHKSVKEVACTGFQ